MFILLALIMVVLFPWIGYGLGWVGIGYFISEKAEEIKRDSNWF